MKRWSFILGLGALCLSTAAWQRVSAAEVQPAYRVGLARKCITPEEPLWLAGYMGRSRPSEGVLDDLYAQALAVEDAGGRRALLLTVDLCVLRTPTINQICRRITERTGLKREQILVNLSHTHSGPATDLLDIGFPMSPDDRRKLEAYTERVKSHLVDLAQLALGDLKPAGLAFGVGRATFFENRRRLNAAGRYVGMGPNPQNHTDRDVPVLRVTNPDGNVRALIFGAACHNVTLGGNSYKISGDYAGFARMHIEKQLLGVQALFVTGCGADANPNPRSTADQEQWAARHGESLGAQVLKVLSGPMQPVTGPVRTAFAFVDLSLSEAPSRPELEKLRRAPTWKSHVAGLMLAALDRGETLPTKYSAPISVWQFGESLTLVGLPEETVSEYVPLLERKLGADGLWIAGYCNDVSGYLPTVKILNEGGYETRGLFGPNIGWFAPEAEAEVVEAVSRLAGQVGRTPFVEMSAETLADKIHGGLLGQLLGNLNGLKHEMKYIDRPGSVESYVPGLPDGARTDDDTDLEWVYTIGIEKHSDPWDFRNPRDLSELKQPLLSYPAVTRLWKSHINQRIWCANKYAREMMDLGIEPPLTGRPALNPWSDFNISGQFVCETFGLMAPGMPQTAARTGLHYTHVTIDGEPAQTTQLFTAMIATAFLSGDLERILDAGTSAIDPECVIRQVVDDARRWHREMPDDWRATRTKIKEKYTRHGGGTRDRNGYELNTASTIAALLYGNGDFVETLRIAFNFGWDADNNAATSGTIIGVINGRKWFDKQGWNIKDIYRNTTREGMPTDETISRFANRVLTIAGRTIESEDGRRLARDGKTVYQIRVQQPAVLEKLPDPDRQSASLQKMLRKEIEAGLQEDSPETAKARAAYLSVCLDLAAEMKRQYADRWNAAITALRRQSALISLLKRAPGPLADTTREKFHQAGVLDAK